MDTQIKLIYSNGYVSQEITLNSETDWGQPLFQFPEYGKCRLTLETEQPTVKLTLEDMSEEGIVELLPNQTLELSTGGHQNDGYIPGNFLVQLHTETRIYQGYYLVEAQSLSQRDLDRMRECLEERANGISRNLYSQKLTSYDVNTLDHSLDLLNYLSQNVNELILVLDRIKKSPIENLEQCYEVTMMSKKQTAKSVRWAMTKGLQYRDALGQQLYYEQRKWLNCNTLENRYLKYMIQDIIKQLSHLNQHCFYCLEDLNKRINGLQPNIAQLETNLTHLNKSRNVENLRKQKMGLTSELEIKKRERAQYEKKKELQESYLKQIHYIESYMIYFLNETWMREIPLQNKPMVTARLLKHRDYAFVYRLYQEMNRQPQEGQKASTFPYQQTSRLFEYYNVFLLLDCFEREGFRWTKGWLMDEAMQGTQTITLNAEEEIWLEHQNGYRVRISYDKFLKSGADVQQAQEAQLVSVNSSSRRPDVLAELFNGDSFVSALIVEAKYRKLGYIYQKWMETDVVKQLIDYRALNYYNPNARPRMKQNVIDTIVVTYPNHKGSRFIDYDIYDFKFIPISPTDFTYETEGVPLIQQMVQEFLMRQMTE